ncbi:exonuclease subunit SbcD [Glaciecola sp. KUL10]|uniref:exonuclease subunit SbcD n=1 Tax=Glaciecola sp. (strain KUL10) TaxID=2161813 RepID=UPI000D82F891|nr:exonuclease subunit SbcD [Glaciecola sp. KUL10]GBL05754.1 Exonuclease SbcD [Glaciecola sp. KUL10]
MMKFIHTSDWHLGHSLKGKSRHSEHEQFLAWLYEQALVHQVDALIVAGDIFDTSAPSSRAREIYQSFIAKLSHTNIQLILLGGNHDSVAVLNESKAIAAELNAFVIPSTGMAIDEQVLTLREPESNNALAVVCAVPFIRATDVLRSEAGQDDSTKKKALGEAITQHYATLFEMAKVEQAKIETAEKRTVPIIATGHLTAVGASLSESVREIYIGTLEAFPANNFPNADYIALGHIHKPQIVAKQDHIRYCGSPIPLSFDEISYQKKVNLVSFTDESNSPEITEINVPLFQALKTIKGDLASIEAQIATLKETLNGQSLWLNVEVEKQDYLADLNQKVLDMLQGSAIELLALKRSANKDVQLKQLQATQTLDDLNPDLVFEKLLSFREISKNDESYMPLKALFNEIKNEVETAQIEKEEASDKPAVDDPL